MRCSYIDWINPEIVYLKRTRRWRQSVFPKNNSSFVLKFKVRRLSKDEQMTASSYISSDYPVENTYTLDKTLLALLS